jgi:hypothetical protein
MGSAHHDRGRLPVPRGEADETMPAITLEKALLRRSVDEHESQRHRCVHCHRTPLTGEVVHIYPTGDGERLVCELCRPLRRQEPARSELMHAPEHERSVRLKHRAA